MNSFVTEIQGVSSSVIAVHRIQDGQGPFRQLDDTEFNLSVHQERINTKHDTYLYKVGCIN